MIEQDVTNLRHTKKPDFILGMRVERNWIAGYTDCDLPYKLQLGGNKIVSRLACSKEQKPCTCRQHKDRYSAVLQTQACGTVAPPR